MGDKSLPLVSIITVNYNQWAVTAELLDSLRTQDYPALEVIVVDNASKTPVPADMINEYEEVRFLRSDENLGFAGGNNIGIRASNGDFLFFVNNDAEVPAGAIHRLLDLYQEVPDLGAVSPLLCYYNENPGQAPDLIQYAGTTYVHPLTARNRTLGEKEPDRGQFSSPKPTAYVHGAAMMIPRSVIERVGLMPENFFLYYEELDWSEQMRRAGYSLYIEPRAKIYHKESLSVGAQSTLKTYYLNRNRILFMRRNQGRLHFAAFAVFWALVTLPKQIFSFAIKGKWAHIRSFWKATIWHFSHSSGKYQAARA